MSSLPNLTLHTNIWLETDDGQVAFSRWRLELLEHIDRLGSISSAAKAMNIQYRLAWQRVKEMEARLGFTLVATQVGGVGGGGAHLTPEAQTLIQSLRTMFDTIDACVREQEETHLRKLNQVLETKTSSS